MLRFMFAFLILATTPLLAQDVPPPSLGDFNYDIHTPGPAGGDTGFDFEIVWESDDGSEVMWEVTKKGEIIEWGFGYLVTPGVWDVWNASSGLDSTLEWNGSAFSRGGGDGSDKLLVPQ